ncbi:DUF2752 domain-containing protein [Lacrimispora saccharolytica]|uniref:DUF2752 domain-containing protein n=1 Tax=Lacrimispora saccharolytica (strain ATCC 35040 / DSM 2544 / NRCC 2533 / WM1) TaxID=610130 RepID=D9R4R3_LACSW|nr:DUF2752 domain-containing protein [Lacrimispora saccharolytica]ADL03247.1 conserved hypothetical protein [[Clostridium] saccharolyticum WM1]QRV18581.1 DUF2752 domain-containing protein [Lacrimispora saccharolytica]
MNWLKKIFGLGLPCLFHSLTGLYCPGCGGTRAVRSLLQGDLRMSFQYHPLVLYACFVFFMELILRTAFQGKLTSADHRKRDRIWILAGAAITAANLIFKNYMLVFKGVDLLPLMR